MLLFLIGLSVAILGVVLLLNTLNSVFLLVFTLGLLISVISAFRPLSGWETPKMIKQYHLLPIIDNTNIYAIQDNNGNVMYKYKDYITGIKCISSRERMNTIIEEINENQIPVLKKSKVKPRRTLWAFPILSEKHVDVLCIPKGGIIR